MYAIDLLWSLIEIIICNQGVLQSEISKTWTPHGLKVCRPTAKTVGSKNIKKPQTATLLLLRIMSPSKK